MNKLTAIARNIRQRLGNQKFSLTSCVGAALLLMQLSLGMPTTAFAGRDASQDYPGICTFQDNTASTSVYCYGSMASVRAQQDDPERYFFFSKEYAEGFSYLLFIGYINGITYSCVAPDTPEWNAMWDNVMATNTYFYVGLDLATGACTAVQSISGSSFKSATAL